MSHDVRVQNTAKVMLFVGERRSETAVRQGWTWSDGRLAAKPLFEALRAIGVEPTAQAFHNLWTDPPGQPRLRRDTLRAMGRGDRLIVALGKKVSRELARRGIEHVTLVHPAARGRIRLRARYLDHVAVQLAPSFFSRKL